jgi:predicted dehydrogenase
MHLRGRYGHGGRPGYDREWRAQPERSGGGELIDQGMHLLDLTHWLAGPLPLHSALLRTQFWDTPVEDNAALILGEGRRAGPRGRCST